MKDGRGIRGSSRVDAPTSKRQRSTGKKQPFSETPVFGYSSYFSVARKERFVWAYDSRGKESIMVKGVGEVREWWQE